MNPTSNPITPNHEITLGGAVRQLRFRHRDFATAEYMLRRQGWPISLLGPDAKEFWAGVSIPTEVDGQKAAVFDQFSIGVLLYVGLLHADRKLTLEAAQSLITWENYDAVAPIVMAAAADGLAPLIERTNKQEADETAPLSPGANGGPDAGPSAATTSDSPSKSSGG